MDGAGPECMRPGGVRYLETDRNGGRKEKSFPEADTGHADDENKHAGRSEV